MNWTRAIVGGLLAEALVFLMVGPVYFAFGAQVETMFSVGASFAGPFIVARWWVAKRIQSHFVLHGAIVGVVAFLAYMAVDPNPQPLIYWVRPRAENRRRRGRRIRGGTRSPDARVPRYGRFDLRPARNSDGVSILMSYRRADRKWRRLSVTTTVAPAARATSAMCAS
jgi:hypothetical protein